MPFLPASGTWGVLKGEWAAYGNWMQLVSYISYLFESNISRETHQAPNIRNSISESLPSTSRFGLLGSIARFHKLQGIFSLGTSFVNGEVDTFFTLRPEKDYLAVWCLRGDRNCWGVGGQDLVPPRTLENIKNWNIRIIWKSYHISHMIYISYIYTYIYMSFHITNVPLFIFISYH